MVKVTATAICGSDLHLYNHYITTMQKGDILGHEFMGEVVEVGRNVKKLRKGDRVVVPFPIACGKCGFCVRPSSSVASGWRSDCCWPRHQVGSDAKSHRV